MRQSPVRPLEAHEDCARPVSPPGQDSEGEGRRRRRQDRRRGFDAHQGILWHRSFANVVAGLEVDDRDADADGTDDSDGEQQQRRQEERRQRRRQRRQQQVEEQAQELSSRQSQDVAQLRQVREKAGVGEKLTGGNENVR